MERKASTTPCLLTDTRYDGEPDLDLGVEYPIAEIDNYDSD